MTEDFLLGNKTLTLLCINNYLTAADTGTINTLGVWTLTVLVHCQIFLGIS